MKFTIMKSLSLCLLIAAALTGLSCVSDPKGNEPPPTPPPVQRDEPVADRPVVPEEIIEPIFEEIFDQYQAALIMDGARNHTVVTGDTLYEITRTYWGNLNNVYSAGVGNGFYFPVIMLASPHHEIADPDLIHPGMELIIPDLQRNLDNPGSRKAIKDCLHDVALIYRIKNETFIVQGLTTLSDSIPQ